MDEHGGHRDLRGSGHRSVIPYIHGRVLYVVQAQGLNLLESVWRF
jgi:hypothetical protein